MYDYSFFHMNIRANARARYQRIYKPRSTQADDELMRTLMEETGASAIYAGATRGPSGPLSTRANANLNTGRTMSPLL